VSPVGPTCARSDGPPEGRNARQKLDSRLNKKLWSLPKKFPTREEIERDIIIWRFELDFSMRGQTS
jgi:hypothetical protein